MARAVTVGGGRTMKVTILDYGAGNLHSLSQALAMPGAIVATEVHPLRALETDVLVLPGVGAFGQAAATLAPWRDRIRGAIADGLRCVGIGLGMQLLFESSEEGPGRGLGVLEGRVRRLRAERIPHIGWSSVVWGAGGATGEGSLGEAYFANSYVCEPSDVLIVRAWTEHQGDRFAAVVARERITGVQFHPEKSGTSGVSFLREILTARTPTSARSAAENAVQTPLSENTPE